MISGTQRWFGKSEQVGYAGSRAVATESEAGSQAEAHEAVVRQQNTMASAGDDNRLLFDAENRGMRFSQTHGLVRHNFRFTPLLDGRQVDRAAMRQSPDALFTPLYRPPLSDAGRRLPSKERIAFFVVALQCKTCPMLSQSLRCHA